MIVTHASYLPTDYSLRHGDGSIIFAFPPVIPDFWYQSVPVDKKIKSLHIGNLKKIDDAVMNDFVRFITKNNVDVYGSGWKDLIHDDRYKGSLSMGSLSEVYSKAQIALGIMYPEQRKFSFSGRFFQAPLAGTPLITEASPLLSNCPGIYEVDYSQGHGIDHYIEMIGGHNIADESYEFWRKLTVDLSRKLNLNLNARLSLSTNFNSATNLLRSISSG
jgi:hypothetical protein